jgi:hypothetical protein
VVEPSALGGGARSSLSLPELRQENRGLLAFPASKVPSRSRGKKNKRSSLHPSDDAPAAIALFNQQEVRLMVLHPVRLILRAERVAARATPLVTIRLTGARRRCEA